MEVAEAEEEVETMEKAMEAVRWREGNLRAGRRVRAMAWGSDGDAREEEDEEEEEEREEEGRRAKVDDRSSSTKPRQRRGSRGVMRKVEVGGLGDVGVSLLISCVLVDLEKKGQKERRDRERVRPDWDALHISPPKDRNVPWRGSKETRHWRVSGQTGQPRWGRRKSPNSVTLREGGAKRAAASARLQRVRRDLMKEGMLMRRK
jgi:hypothetical protein